MKKVFYEKVGRKYIPVKEYDSALLDSLPYGNHLIMVYKNGSSGRYNIDPALAPMIAAGRYAIQPMCDEIMKADSIHPSREPLTEEQVDAWRTLSAAFGEEAHSLSRNSIYDIASAGISALQDEASKLLSNPAIKNAYEEFMLVCKLAKESE